MSKLAMTFKNLQPVLSAHGRFGSKWLSLQDGLPQLAVARKKLDDLSIVTNRSNEVGVLGGIEKCGGQVSRDSSTLN
jgi:hypothetical protein